MHNPEGADLIPANCITIDAGARATRFALACVVMGISYFLIRASLNISSVQSVYEDMLGGGTQLPAATLLILRAQDLLLGASFVIPMIGVAMLFLRNIPRAICVLGLLVAAAFVLLTLFWHGLYAPLTEMVKRMQGGAPG